MNGITRGKLRLWSSLGARATYGMAVLEAARTREDFYVLTADLCQSSGLARFRDEFPERLINVGIAEQNMLGVAAGLARDGTNVFASSFAPFITMRACEQARMNMGYMQLNIKTVGLGSGLVMAQLGNSHFGLEDAAVMRAIPGMTVISPADGLEIMKAVEALCDYPKPAYLRLTGGPGLPTVYQEDYDFRIGKAVTLREGQDVCIVAAGTMAAFALRAAELLAERGVGAEVVNMHTLKPLDGECLTAQLGKKLLVTVEEASVVGGLGSAVAEYLAPLAQRPPQLILGIPDVFPHAGSYSYLLEQCGLTAEGIASRIADTLEKRGDRA